MELRIGENIKRMRKNKGLTQEQLAELLNVSCAAVSKWESCDTYPDITMIFPLAHLFEVSVDELMGYDAARTDEEIEKIISDHWKLQVSGKYREATQFITNARKHYPNDYRIMSRYMWDLAGGSADNNPEVLKKHNEEFMQICDCILSGCADESLRLETMTMKAKLLHASGKTPAALEILAQFPSWYQSAGQKTEQLFAKDTPEFRYWVRRNLYELADGTANKMIKVIWYEDNITMEERVSRGEAIGDLFTTLRKQSDENVFAIFEHMAFAELSGKLTFFGGSPEDIIRTRDKTLTAAKVVTEAAKKDNVLRELLVKTYKTDNLVQWTINWLKTAPQDPLVRLRENKDYMAMLEKFSNT